MTSDIIFHLAMVICLMISIFYCKNNKRARKIFLFAAILWGMQSIYARINTAEAKIIDKIQQLDDGKKPTNTL